jgi:indolepyruvate ferredoxin oxidoreductase
VLLAKHQDDIQTTRVSMAAADLILGCDPIVTAGKETLSRMIEGRTHVALNSHSTPTAEFVKNTQWENPADSCAAEIASAVGVQGLASFDADDLSSQLMGDTIYINPMLLGYAWQKGWVPLSLDALKRAIELNEVAVAQNLAAFDWGRHAAHQLPAVQALLKPLQIINFKKRDRLEDLIATRVEFLTAYQNASYAKQYEEFVLKVNAKESTLSQSLLSETVARQLFRLMAYKDEYEVARLHTDKQFLERVKTQFEGDFKVFYHLAPPIIAKRNEKGHLIKQKMSPHMLLAFKVLAKLKFLRGSALDLFGRTEERQTERALIQEYKDAINELLASLNSENHALAVKMANVTEQIKGFGHVKEKHLAAVVVQWQNCMDAFRKAI